MARIQVTFALSMLLVAAAVTTKAASPVQILDNHHPEATKPYSGNPLKRAAYTALETHCARCHQTDRLIGRSKAAAGLANILDLDAMAAARQYLKPGRAESSLIYNRLKNRLCPTDVFIGGDMDQPMPGDKDLAAISNWINSLPAKRKKVRSGASPAAGDVRAGR